MGDYKGIKQNSLKALKHFYSQKQIAEVKLQIGEAVPVSNFAPDD